MKDFTYSKWAWVKPLLIIVIVFISIIVVGTFVLNNMMPSEIVERTTSITFSESGGSFKAYVEENLKKEWKNVTFIDSHFEPTRYQGVRDIKVRFKVSGKSINE